MVLLNPINGYKLECAINPNITLKFHNDVRSVIFSPDGKYLAVGNNSLLYFSAEINNISTQEKVFLVKYKFDVNSVDFSPDGKYLAIGNGYSSEIFCIANQEKVFSARNDASSVNFSPDGKYLATGNSLYGLVEIHKISTQEKVFSVKSDYSQITSVNFSLDGKYLAVGSGLRGYGVAKIFKISTKENVFTAKYGSYVHSVDFSPDENFLAVGSGDYYAGHTEIYNIATKKNVFSAKYKKWVNSVDFSPDGKYLAIGTEDNIADIFNIITKENVFSAEYDKSVNSVNFSPDGKYLAVGTGNNVFLNLTLFQPDEKALANKFISKPPKLTATVNFKDKSNNNYLEALEKGEIIVTVKNSGKGASKGLNIKLYPERMIGLNYNNYYIEEIPAGKTVTAKIPIEAYIDCPESKYVFTINFEELNGFPPPPVELEFSTKAYKKPDMYVMDVGIEDNNRNGMIESGEMIKLTVRIANKGAGYSSGAYATFYSEDNVFISDSYSKVVSLGNLEPNQHIDIPIEFFINDKCPDQIPLFVDLTEASGIAGSEHLRVPITKSKRIREIKRVVVAGIDKSYNKNFSDDLSIDVEKNIPQTAHKNKKALVIIFGIEDYKNVSNVNYAYRDATFMKKYFSETFGIPDEQIYFKANNDVTLGEFNKVFSKNGWLDKRVIKKKTDVYFYYAGHGAPAIKKKKPFLIPYDGDPNYPQQTGYSLDKVFKDLNKLNAKSVTVFLDACFTGVNREHEMLLADARPISIQLKDNFVGNVTLFSATSNNEISSSYPKMKHGLFTYFLMKGLQGNADKNNNESLTVTELFNYLKENVSITAGKLDREQTPELKTLEPNKILINYDGK